MISLNHEITLRFVGLFFVIFRLTEKLRGVAWWHLSVWVLSGCSRLIGDSKIGLRCESEWSFVCLCVSSVMNWRPVQGVTRLLCQLGAMRYGKWKMMDERKVEGSLKWPFILKGDMNVYTKKTVLIASLKTNLVVMLDDQHRQGSSSGNHECLSKILSHSPNPSNKCRDTSKSWWC